MDFEVKDGYVVATDNKGNAELIASEIWIKQRKIDIIGGNCSVILEYKINGKSRTQEIDRKSLEPNILISLLLNLGIYVNPRTVKSLVEFLQLTEAEAEISYVHNLIGLQKIDDKNFFLLNNSISIDGDIESKYAGRLKIEEQGSYDIWHELANRLVETNLNMALALAIGLSAPLVALLREPLGLDNLYFNFYGTSSTGKTSACYFLLSAFGFPLKTSDGLMLTYNSTHNALVGSLADNNGVPMVIDEASVKGNYDFSSFIYIMADGRDKMRQTKAGINKIPAKWNTTVVSTSEMSLLENSNQNLGIYMRLIELSHVKWTSSVDEAEEIKNVFSKNYGHAGKIFVEKLMKVPVEKLMKNYIKIKEATISYINANDNFSYRLCEKYAIIMLTAQYANHFLNLKISKEIIEVLAETKNGKNEELDQAENALAFVINYAITNINSFYIDDKSIKIRAFSQFRNKQVPFGKMIGKIEMDITGFDVIYITRQKFDEILKENSFNDVSGILSKWSDDKIIEHYDGRFTKRISFCEDSPSINTVVINVPSRYKVDDLELPEEWADGGEDSE